MTTREQKMMDLFPGSSTAHGEYLQNSKKVIETEKVEGRAKTAPGPVTLEMFRTHLKGGTGVGIIPIVDGNVCYWCAIDVDQYPIDFIKWSKLLEGSPCILIKSKSGGAHIVVFFKVPLPPKEVREKLKQIVTLLHLPKATEIFPKQNFIEEGRYGNWLNMPYWKTDQRCAVVDGKEIDIDAFLLLAESKKISSLKELTVKENYASWSDGPPCLESLSIEGVQTGFRNNGLFGFAIYAKKKFGDNWEKQLDIINQTHLIEPLPSSEVASIVSSLNKNPKYAYRCSEAPLANYCQSTVCTKRKFGINSCSGRGGSADVSGGDGDYVLGQFTIIKSEPPVYLIQLDDRIIRTSVDDLIDHNRFRKQVIKHVPDLLIGRRKAAEWDQLLREKLMSAEQWDAPPDVTLSGKVMALLSQFVNGGAQARTEADIVAGKPFKNSLDNRVYFRFIDLNRMLITEKSDISPNLLWAVLTGTGAEFSTIFVGGKTIDVWSLPLEILESLPDELTPPPVEETEI